MADVIETTTITFDSLGLGGNAFVSPIYIRLESNAVQYKLETILRSCEFTVVPNEITGEASVDLIETDNMDGTQYYRADFGNGVVYRFQVPVSIDPINLFDLPTLERTSYNRNYPFVEYTTCT